MLKFTRVALTAPAMDDFNISNTMIEKYKEDDKMNS